MLEVQRDTETVRSLEEHAYVQLNPAILHDDFFIDYSRKLTLAAQSSRPSR